MQRYKLTPKVMSLFPAIRNPRAPKASARNIGKAAAKQRMLKQLVCSDAPEQALRHRGFVRIAGVDEVGRGALFGPVVAAAVILPEGIDSLSRAGLKDSKQMKQEEREELDVMIRDLALCVSVAEIDAETIDRVNIYQATRMAMLAAVMGLSVEPDHLLIDAHCRHRVAWTSDTEPSVWLAVYHPAREPG